MLSAMEMNELFLPLCYIGLIVQNKNTPENLNNDVL